MLKQFGMTFNVEVVQVIDTLRGEMSRSRFMEFLILKNEDVRKFIEGNDISIPCRKRAGERDTGGVDLKGIL